MEEKIKEVMGLIYDRNGKEFISAEVEAVPWPENDPPSEAEVLERFAAAENAARKAIEAKLRKLIEIKPLSIERLYEIERESYLSYRRPEHKTDRYGNEKTTYHDDVIFSAPLFMRNLERAYNITP